MVTPVVKYFLATSTIRNVLIPVSSICMLTSELEMSTLIICTKDIHG